MDIGIHIASLSPWSLLPLVGHQLAERMALKVGFTWWYMMPLRGVSKKSLAKSRLPITHHQEAWNATTPWKHFVERHWNPNARMGTAGLPTQTWDPVMFPSPQACQQLAEHIGLMGSQRVVIDIKNYKQGDLLEVHKGMGIAYHDLVMWSLFEKKPLMLDFKHLIVYGNSEEYAPLGSWPDVLRNLVPYTSLIQVSAPTWDDNGIRILKAQVSMVKKLGYAKKVKWMIEFNPMSLKHRGFNRKELLERLIYLKKMTEEIINN